MTPFERRIAKLEAAKRERGRQPVPHILFVSIDETQPDAHARFHAAWPNRKPGHAVLVVPAKPRTAADEALYEERLFVSQLMLVAAAKRESRPNEKTADF